MQQDFMVEHYRSHGILSRIHAFDSCYMSSATSNFKKSFEEASGRSDLFRLFGHLRYPWVARMISDEKILKVVRRIIGSDIIVWVSEFNIKNPHTRNFFSWHQDFYYWGFKSVKMCAEMPITTAWIALTAANECNGCMQVIERSHDILRPHLEIDDQDNLLTRCQTVLDPKDDATSSLIELEPGEFSLHHPLLQHCSGANTSAEQRVGLVVRNLVESE